MDTLSADILVKALDGLNARAEITAANIANANTPRYRAQHLNFERSLAAAASEGSQAVRSVAPSITRDNREMRLDLELATANSTSLRYAALIDILNRQLQLDALAIQGNN